MVLSVIVLFLPLLEKRASLEGLVSNPILDGPVLCNACAE